MLDKILDKFSIGILFVSFILSIILTIIEFLIAGYLDDTTILVYIIGNMIIFLSIFYIFNNFFNKEKPDEPK